MSWVYVHTVFFHGFGYLHYDASSGCFDSQIQLNLKDMVGEAGFGVDTVGLQDLSKPKTFSIDDMVFGSSFF